MLYLVWFISNRRNTEMHVKASSRREAIALFAAHHNCVPSSYIQARKA